ncbi:MAG: hypothetical protein JXX28_19130 [Deltaproteobacteria bacterium]|nr:hypothetical protein [Deltaproteobacteria bacterium]
MLWLLLLSLALAETGDQTLIYYNARMALREGKPLEATKLWLLRNAVEERTGRVSPYDEDLLSVTWAALGELGVCQDGLPLDEEGVGLWPLALHNWVVQNRRRRARPHHASPFQSFEVDRQQRYVSIGDVLGAQELRTVRLYRGACYRQRAALVAAGEGPTAKLSDPAVAARLLESLLLQAEQTLDGELVRGAAVIDARRFDLHLQLAALAEKEARRQAQARGRAGRLLGLSRESVQVMREDAPVTTLEPDASAAQILRAAPGWPTDEWMALSADRRLFLFDHARSFGETVDPVGLAILDAMIARGEGEEVDRWIGHLQVAPEVLWRGGRGERLLALDEGFGERSVIALHRGVDALERGDLPGALRSMAFALQHAPDSREAEQVRGLSLRWLTYVAAQFEITDELLLTLQELVSVREYSLILEDLMWSAAFRADRRSFERGLDNQVGRGALERRVALLHPLARGELGLFVRGLRVGLETSPSETLRFLDQLLQRLALDDAEVRQAQLPTLRAIRGLLLPLTGDAGGAQQGRKVAELLDRAQGMLEGLGAGGGGQAARIRSVDPTAVVYAGSVRLAPVDPLPWPFPLAEVAAPSVFLPIRLTPVEWRDGEGRWVYGWTVSE